MLVNLKIPIWFVSDDKDFDSNYSKIQTQTALEVFLFRMQNISCYFVCRMRMHLAQPISSGGLRNVQSVQMHRAPPVADLENFGGGILSTKPQDFSAENGNSNLLFFFFFWKSPNFGRKKGLNVRSRPNNHS